jgi:hypothetical protein
MPRCIFKIVKSGKRCKINAADGSEYCWRHDPNDAEVELEVDEEEVNLPMPPALAPPAPAPPAPAPPAPAPPAPAPPALVNMDDAIAQIINSIAELKIAVTSSCATSKKRRNKTRNKDINVVALRLLYHDMKKNNAFLEFIGTSHNLNPKNLPWTLVKQKSDEYWKTMDKDTMNKYFEQARALI